MGNRNLASQAFRQSNRRLFGRSVLELLALLSVATVSAAIVLVSFPAKGQESPASERACAELVSLTFEGNTIMTVSTTVSGGSLVTPTDQILTGLPPFCRVTGVSRPTSDSEIRFEVWLPSDSWNGKFVSSGEGGFAGRLNYTRLGLDGGLDEWLRRG